MNRIMVVEDEDAIREFVIINLKRAGYETLEASSGENALELFDQVNGEIDVVILDIMMPGIDGFTVCKKLRERTKSLGIIMLSARSQEMDKVSGLMLGADDYMTTPFSPSELVARVDAVCRRMVVAKDAPIDQKSVQKVVGGVFELDLKGRTLIKSGLPIDLTQVEFQIMEYLMKNEDTALERSDFLNKIWGDSYYGDIKIVDVNIRRLRMKIEEDASNPEFIQTVWGFGYKWKP